MDALDLVEARGDAIAHLQGGFDGGVSEASARIGLDVEARAHEIVAAPEVRKRLKGHVEAAAERAEITCRTLERRGMRGEAALAEQRRHDAVARRLAGMQGLGHGSEIHRDAA